jgi:nucleoside 2-deoxyribosyltransferase
MSKIRPVMIYLAGPIDGIDIADAQAWREAVADHIGTGVLLYSPAHAYFNASEANAQIVMNMNRHAIVQSDGVLVNQMYLKGYGTIREIEFARLQGKPVAVATKEKIEHLLAAYDLIVRHSLLDAAAALLEAIVKGRHTPSGPFVLMMGEGLANDEGDDESS